MKDFLEQIKDIAGRGKTDDEKRRIDDFTNRAWSNSTPGRQESQEQRISELERDVKNLTVAVLILLNAKEKRSQAKIPRELLNGTARVIIHYEDTGPHCVATIRVQKS